MTRQQAICASFCWQDDAWVCSMPELNLKRIYVGMPKFLALRAAAAWLRVLASEDRPIRLNIYRKAKPGSKAKPGIEAERFYPKRLDPRRRKG